MILLLPSRSGVIGSKPNDDSKAEPGAGNGAQATMTGMSLAPQTPPSDDPVAVVQRQFEAYNARDLDAMLATYAEDAQQFEHPDKLIARGAAEIRVRFAVRFQEPNLHATLLNRVVMGDLVIDHERVTRTYPEGPGSVELLAIYEVKAGRIARAWFRFGERVLSGAVSRG